MTCQSRGEVIDLVVGLRDDDACLAAGCQGGRGLDDERAGSADTTVPPKWVLGGERCLQAGHTGGRVDQASWAVAGYAVAGLALSVLTVRDTAAWARAEARQHPGPGGPQPPFREVAALVSWKDRTLAAGLAVITIGIGHALAAGLTGAFLLTDRLAERGFDAMGVDPEAPDRPRLVRGFVEQETDPGAFDAVIAVMALHHAELDAVASSIAGLLRPGGRLLVYDFDWNAFDVRAAAWLASRDSSGADNSVAGWRHEHRALHQGMAMKRALSAAFVPAIDVGRPYLARMLDRPDLEVAEHALIGAQQLPALGFWLIADRAG